MNSEKNNFPQAGEGIPGGVKRVQSSVKAQGQREQFDQRAQAMMLANQRLLME